MLCNLSASIISSNSNSNVPSLFHSFFSALLFSIATTFYILAVQRCRCSLRRWNDVTRFFFTQCFRYVLENFPLCVRRIKQIEMPNRMIMLELTREMHSRTNEWTVIAFGDCVILCSVDDELKGNAVRRRKNAMRRGKEVPRKTFSNLTEFQWAKKDDKKQNQRRK